jgi:hypothetical protein
MILRILSPAPLPYPLWAHADSLPRSLLPGNSLSHPTVYLRIEQLHKSPGKINAVQIYLPALIV